MCWNYGEFCGKMRNYALSSHNRLSLKISLRLLYRKVLFYCYMLKLLHKAQMYINICEVMVTLHSSIIKLNYAKGVFNQRDE